MTKNENATNNDPEHDFFEILNCDEIDANLITSTIQKSQDTISNILNIPTNTLILNYEIFTRHPFGGSLREREAHPFYKALLYVSQFFCLLYKSQKNIKQFSDQVRSVLHDDWDNCTKCPQLQQLMKAAFGIISGDDELMDSSFQPKYISFLADVFILQSTLCSSCFFQHILTAIGQIFVLIPAENYTNRINAFRDSERNSTGNDEHSKDFQSFLRLVGNISRLRKGNDDFAYKFHQEGNVFIHYATDFISKSLFATFIDTLAALTKSTAIADNFYKRLNESLSDINNLKHIVEVFSGYASDFQNNEINQHKLDYDDANSLEAILHLLSGFFTYSKAIRDDILDDPNRRYDENQASFVPSLINLISSPIPASLKAAIFDTLSSITVETRRAEDIWQQLESSQILTKNSVQTGKGGIISDIDVVETDAKTYPLMRSFIVFLSSFLASKPSPEILEYGSRYFKIQHQFLLEQGLLKLRSRIYSHFHEKWSILSKICQTWTNLLLLDNKKAYACLMQTALCDFRFIGELITLINEDDIPEESLLCMFRLLLLIIENEPEFLKTMNPSDRIFYTPITKRFSWSSSALVKIIQCVASNDYDLQLVTLNFAQHLAKDSPNITQVVFSRPQAKAILSFKKVIDVDDKEFEEKGRNVRNTLLEFLISLRSSSYFVRHVCNFDLMDPPQSIINSTLEKGILPEILRKMKETEAAKNYPSFAANSLKFFLMICDDPLTSKPLLNLLRISPQSFFDKQLRMLQAANSRCSLTTIGCFLQLLARETMDSMHDSFSSTTLLTFRILMETNGFREQSRQQIVLFDEFIERIDDSTESECVSRGIFETTIAYISSTSALKRMVDNQGHWAKIWCQFIIHLFEKMSSLVNENSINFLSQAVGIISLFLFSDQKLGEITIEDRIKIFNHACHALGALNRNVYSRHIKLGIYSLLSCMKLDGLESSFRDQETNLVGNLADDIEADTPVLKASVYAAAESIIKMTSVDILQNVFIIRAIQSIQSEQREKDSNNDYSENGSYSDSNYFIENPGASLMIAAQYSFFNRLLASMPNEYQSFLVENSLIARISREFFWNIIRESFFSSTQFLMSETILQVASKALHVITNLCIFDIENESVKNEVSQFFSDYFEEQFLPIFHFPETLTLSALKFLLDLAEFFSFMPDQMTVAQRNELKKVIRETKKQFIDNSEKIRDKVRVCGEKSFSLPPPEIMKEVDEVIDQFKKFDF